MDLKNFKQMRYLRVVSHNGNSSAPDNVPSASNFNVVLGDDMSRVGELTAYSLDGITFPNLFPNIRSVDFNNEMLLRLVDIYNDTYTTSIDHVVYQPKGGQEVTVPVPGGAPAGTTVFLPWFQALPGISGVFDITWDPYGAVIMRSLIGPVNLGLYMGSDTWNTTFGFDPSQTGGYNTLWIGYPADNSSDDWPFKTITIPQGFYDQEQLVALIQPQLDALLPLGSNFLIDIVSNGADSFFRIDRAGEGFMLVPRSRPGEMVNIEPNYRQLVYQMGFQNFPIVATDTNTATLNPALQGEQIAYLHSNILSSSRKSYSGEGGADSVIAAININVPYGALVEAHPNQWADPGFVFERGISARQFDFTLRNQYNENLDIGWNQTMTLFFRMFFDYRVDIIE